MLGMYPSKNANISIFFGAVHVFAGLLYLLRNQSTVDDVDYIEAMIPHHSIAILTSERAQIRGFASWTPAKTPPGFIAVYRGREHIRIVSGTD